MKIIPAFIALLFTATISLSQTSGGGGGSGTPKYWMLTSPGAFRAYALSLVKRGESYAFGGTVINDTYVNVQGANVDEVTTMLRGEAGKMNIELLDPEHDVVHVGSTLMNEKWEPIITGYSFYLRPVMAADGSSKWELPSYNLQPRLAYSIPIQIPDSVTEAELYYRDENSEFQWVEGGISAGGGTLYFPSQYATGQGQLVLKSPGEEPVVINLESGKQISPITIDHSVEMWLTNYASFNDDGYPAASVIKIEGVFVYSDDPSYAPVVGLEFSMPRTFTSTCGIYDEAGQLADVGNRAFAFNTATGKVVVSEFGIVPGGSNIPVCTMVLPAGRWIVWYETPNSYNRAPIPPWDNGKG